MINRNTNTRNAVQGNRLSLSSGIGNEYEMPRCRHSVKYSFSGYASRDVKRHAWYTLPHISEIFSAKCKEIRETNERVGYTMDSTHTSSGQLQAALTRN